MHRSKDNNQTHTLGLLLLTSLAILWALGVLYAPALIYWRDSGEFLISAFFLDIPHPAGFPLYSQLANAFALLPFGQIAWRIHSFSVFLGILLFALSYSISFRLLYKKLELPCLLSKLTAALTPICLLSSMYFTRQAVSAEVYLLYAVCTCVLLACYLEYRITCDSRWLLTAMFLGGLATGSHVAIVPFLLIALFLIITEFKSLRTIILPGVLLFLFGATVYSYIPIRAHQNLPLNSGGVTSVKRAQAFFTNERGWKLRPRQGQALSHQGAAPLRSHIDRLEKAFALPLFLLALLALPVLKLTDWRMAFALIGAGALNWYFFMSWDPDPWVLLVSVLSILVSVSVGAAIKHCPKKHELKLTAVALVFVSALAFNSIKQSTLEASELSRSTSASAAAEKLLSIPMANSTLLLQHSWFLARYLQTVEGYRNDLALQYLPSLLHPKYFRPVSLCSENSKFKIAKSETESQLAQFVNYTSKAGSLYVEATTALNSRMSNILQLNKAPLATIKRGEQGSVSQEYYKDLTLYLNLLRAQDSGSSLQQADTQHYLEIVASGLADVLRGGAQQQQAASLLASVCAPFHRARCSTITLNNLLLFATESGQYGLAISAIRSALTRRPSLPAAMIHNTRILNNLLPEELRKELMESLPDHLHSKVLEHDK